MESKTDVLLFAPHPDDAEIFCGGTIAALTAKGRDVAVVDLTKGELSTGGSLEIRGEETSQASTALGLNNRINLELPDGGIARDGSTPSGREQLVKVVETLRQLRPKIVLLPSKQSRHPDHSATSELVDQAIFFAGVKNFHPIEGLEKHSPTQVAYYQMRFISKPSFVMNTEGFQDAKLKAIKCYQSQVKPQSSKAEDQTLLNSVNTLESISARDKFYGAMVGTAYGEPFTVKNSIRIDDPVEFFSTAPSTAAQFFWEND